jgi:hypothetical protein
VDGTVVLVNGRVSIREDEAASIVCNDIKIIEKPEKALKRLEYWVKLPKAGNIVMDEVLAVTRKYPGSAKLIIYDEKNKKRYVTNGDYSVDGKNGGLSAELSALLGEKCTAVKEG